MASAITIIGALLVVVIGWCLAHSQRCAARDAALEARLTKVEERQRTISNES
jgi:hypothetical protein